jgi:hypothetical protein
MMKVVRSEYALRVATGGFRGWIMAVIVLGGWTMDVIVSVG